MASSLFNPRTPQSFSTICLQNSMKLWDNYAGTFLNQRGQQTLSQLFVSITCESRTEFNYSDMLYLSLPVPRLAFALSPWNVWQPDRQTCIAALFEPCPNAETEPFELSSVCQSHIPDLNANKTQHNTQDCKVLKYKLTECLWVQGQG